MDRHAATVDIAPHLVPRPRVASAWMPSGDRLELLVPRYRGGIFDRLLRRVAPAEEYWVRYPLGSSASRIFQLIDGERTAADVIVRYRELYPHDADQLEGRVLSFLRVLEHHGFIEFD